MQIKLYKVKKRDNSTYIPQVGDGVYEVSGYLFEPCSVLRPTININFGLVENPASYNYLYIPDFNRYYKITDWTFHDAFWQVSAVCDPLASWKTNILNTTQYVVRSASQFDGKVTDTLYPCKADTQYVETNCEPEEGRVFTDNYGTGCYVIGMIAPQGGTIGGVAYYLTSNTGFNALMKALLSTIDWLEIDEQEISQNIQKMLFNPFDYIVGAMWFPIDIQTVIDYSGAQVAPSPLPYGQWKIDVQGIFFQLPNAGSAFVQRYTVQLPKHPLAATRGYYLNCAPFTRRWLNFPPFGRTSLDTTVLINRDELQLVCRIDMVTGKAQLTAGGLENAVCVYENAQLGVPIQISQITTDFISGITTLGNAASSAVGLIGKAASASPIGTAIAGGAGVIGGAVALHNSGKSLAEVAGGIGNAFQAAFNDVASSGSNGSLVGYGLKPTLGSLFAIPVDDYNAERGRPLCKAVQLSTLSGYTLCENSDVNFPCMAEEAEAIKAYMNSGFYIE